MIISRSVFLVGSSSPSPLRAALERAGFRVLWTRGGAPALTVAAAAAFDDLAAIVLDGASAHALDLITYFHRRFPNAPIVFLTTSEADGAAARARGAAACLGKPADSAVVMAGVSNTEPGVATQETFSPTLRMAAPTAAPLWGIVLATGEGRRLLRLVREIHVRTAPSSTPRWSARARSWARPSIVSVSASRAREQSSSPSSDIVGISRPNAPSAS